MSGAILSKSFLHLVGLYLRQKFNWKLDSFYGGTAVSKINFLVLIVSFWGKFPAASQKFPVIVELTLHEDTWNFNGKCSYLTGPDADKSSKETAFVAKSDDMERPRTGKENGVNEFQSFELFSAKKVRTCTWF